MAWDTLYNIQQFHCKSDQFPIRPDPNLIPLENSLFFEIQTCLKMLTTHPLHGWNLDILEMKNILTAEEHLRQTILKY